MADKWHTFRSDYYKRPVPFTNSPANQGGEIDVEANERGLRDLYRQFGSVIAEGKGMMKNKITGDMRERKEKEESRRTRDEARQELLKNNPWLNGMIKAIANARLNFLNTPGELSDLSKKTGWAHKIENLPPPEASEYFSLKADPENDIIYVDDSDLAAELLDQDQQKYAELRKLYEDYTSDPIKHTFIPLTKEEAEKKQLNWYPTTNEILNSLIDTKLGGDSRSRRALYDAAQFALSQTLLEDNEDKYRKARERMTGEDGEEKATFKPINGVTSALANLALPFSSSVYFDPELKEKTGTGEKLARGTSDVALELFAGGAPKIGGKLLLGLAPRLAPLFAIAGGAGGGAVSYGVNRATNELYDRTTGHGGIEYPIDATDLGLSVALGGLGGLASNANNLRGYRQMRQAMQGSKATKLPSNADVTRSLKFVKNSKNMDEATRRYVADAFADVVDDYPTWQKKVDKLPSPFKDELPPKIVTDKFGNKIIVETSDFMPAQSGQPNTAKYGVPGRDAEKNLVMLGNSDVPSHYASGSDPAFVKQYLKHYKDTKPLKALNITDADIGEAADFGKLVKKAQPEGSPYLEWFNDGGEGYRLFAPDEYSRKLAKLKGDNFNDEQKLVNKTLQKVMRSADDVNVNPVTGKPESITNPKQLKALGKANKEYGRRSSHKLHSKEKLDAYSKNSIPSLGLKAISYGGQGLSNEIPFSNLFFDVSPYKHVGMVEEDEASPYIYKNSDEE